MSNYALIFIFALVYEKYNEMIKNFVEELTWRGMIHTVMPGAEEHLMESMRSAYVGFDPTADSLHIGNLVPIMLLAHYQRCGHRPVALVGGATGMIGDPSGKDKTRTILNEKEIEKNINNIEKILKNFLDIKNPKTKPIFVNNYIPVYMPDIGSKGFKTVMLEDNNLTEQAVKEMAEIIYNEKLAEEIANYNFELGKKYFSYKTLEEKLEELISKAVALVK